MDFLNSATANEPLEMAKTEEDGGEQLKAESPNRALSIANSDRSKMSRKVNDPKPPALDFTKDANVPAVAVDLPSTRKLPDTSNAPLKTAASTQRIKLNLTDRKTTDRSTALPTDATRGLNLPVKK